MYTVARLLLTVFGEGCGHFSSVLSVSFSQTAEQRFESTSPHKFSSTTIRCRMLISLWLSLLWGMGRKGLQCKVRCWRAGVAASRRTPRCQLPKSAVQDLDLELMVLDLL